jgi:hypothetical protein
MSNHATNSRHEWTGKGAVEAETSPQDSKRRPEPDALASQLGHRDQDELLKDNDTDFPEPNAEGEHS